MHRGPAAYVLGPPPSRSRDLELEGGVIACHVEYVYEPQDSHVCEVPSNGVVEISLLPVRTASYRYRLSAISDRLGYFSGVT